jgi:hypothetical protein
VKVVFTGRQKCEDVAHGVVGEADGTCRLVAEDLAQIRDANGGESFEEHRVQQGARCDSLVQCEKLLVVGGREVAFLPL